MLDVFLKKKKTIIILLLVYLSLMMKEAVAAEAMVFSTMGRNVEFPTKTIAKKVVQEAYRRLGMSIEIREYPALRALHVSNSGMVDGELFRVGGVQDNFQNLIMIPVPLFENEWVAFAKNETLRVDGCESLGQYRIAIERGVPPAENCTKGLSVFSLTNEVQMFKMVLVGRADIAVDALLDGRAVMLENNIQGVKALSPSLFKAQLFHYVHRKNQHLVEQITEAVQAVVDEGLPIVYERSVLEKSSESNGSLHQR